MCTFFARCAVIALLLAGCSRNSVTRSNDTRPAVPADTIVINVPAIRLTVDSASGSAPLDSASLALLERRVMSRLSSLLRAEARMAAGATTAGIPPVKNAAPEIRHGLLGTISFGDDGSLDETSRERIAAIAKMLDEIDAPLELRSTSEPGTSNIDVAIARARRVFIELIEQNRSLGDRDVVFSIRGQTSLRPINPQVEILYQLEVDN